ncbi:MAG: 50S ribosomal protein L4 [Planctomycetaceae bacterium]|jgi:large subunit ribosomal protein L4|nr:50S ribosomal protein L4 [Phycisphaerales bacterium]MCE2652324.1 50S ribosomal protein L4 [Planctomycetaceae bacterium]
MEVPVYNKQGSEVGKLTIDEQALGGSINHALLKQAYVRYHANLRQGSSRTLSRKEVEGSSRKLYKQKGTGNARHGDKNAPLFRGGAHAHSKKRTREDYRLDMPKKMRRKANRNALLAKLVDNEVRVVDELSMGAAKTRELVTMLEAMKVDKTALLAVNDKEQNLRLAARNLDSVTLCRPEQLNCFELLNHRYLVIGKQELQAWLTGPSSQTGKDAKVSPKGAAAATPAAKAPKARAEKPAKPAKPAKAKKEAK